MLDPVVLIPGMMCDPRLFRNQIKVLSRDRAVMVAPLTGASSVTDLAAAIVAVAPPKFALAGLGLGGDVALAVLGRAQARVTRVVLMSTDALSETPQAAAAREARMVAARSGRLDEALTGEFPDDCLAEGPGRAEVARLLRDMAWGLGAEAFVSQSRAMQRRPDQQRVLRAARLPALILAGAEDRLVPLRRQQFAADLMPFAQVQQIAGAGHFLPLEQPEEVTRALVTFLAGPMMLR